MLTCHSGRRRAAPLLLVLCVLACIVITVASAQADAAGIRGVRRRDQGRYQGTEFKCDEGKRTVPLARVNDDYCDCQDGFDEPGTSACSQGKFWCANKGAKPKTLPSSRVNDGVCDCCDGSDEYAGIAKCGDRCEEEGREVRESLVAEIEAIEKGSVIKDEMVQKAKVIAADRAAKIAELESRVATLQLDVQDAEAVKKQEEELEKTENARRESEFNETRDKYLDLQSEQADPSLQEAVPVSSGDSMPEQEAREDGTASDAASGDGQEAENFPYPKEYAFPGADENAGDQGDAAFPYPKEYAFPGEENADATVNGEENIDIANAAASEVEPPAAEKPPVELTYVPFTSEETTHEHSTDDSIARKKAHEEFAARMIEETRRLREEEERNPEAARRNLDNWVLRLKQWSESWNFLRHVASEIYLRRLGLSSFANQIAIAWRSVTNTMWRAGETVVSAARHIFPTKRSLTRAVTRFGKAIIRAGRTVAWMLSSNRDDEADEDDDERNHDADDEWEADAADDDDTDPDEDDEYRSGYVPPTDPRYVLPSAEAARKRHKQAVDDHKKAKDELESLKTKASADLGDQGQFAVMQGECYTTTLQKYTYEVCPYDHASQKESSTTSLGKFEKYDREQQVWHFTNGDKCWNGPKRSVAVHLQCGTENKILSVEEPSTCVYMMKFTTPAVCEKAHAAVLQLNLLGGDLDEDDAGDEEHENHTH